MSIPGSDSMVHQDMVGNYRSCKEVRERDDKTHPKMMKNKVKHPIKYFKGKKKITTFFVTSKKNHNFELTLTLRSPLRPFLKMGQRYWNQIR